MFGSVVNIIVEKMLLQEGTTQIEVFLDFFLDSLSFESDPLQLSMKFSIFVNTWKIVWNILSLSLYCWPQHTGERILGGAYACDWLVKFVPREGCFSILEEGLHDEIVHAWGLPVHLRWPWSVVTRCTKEIPTKEILNNVNKMAWNITIVNYL